MRMPAVVRMPACHSRRFKGERPIGAATGYTEPTTKALCQTPPQPRSTAPKVQSHPPQWARPPQSRHGPCSAQGGGCVGRCPGRRTPPLAQPRPPPPPHPPPPHTHSLTHTAELTQTRTRTHAHTHTHTHTRARAHTHTHTRARARADAQPPTSKHRTGGAEVARARPRQDDRPPSTPLPTLTHHRPVPTSQANFPLVFKRTRHSRPKLCRHWYGQLHARRPDLAQVADQVDRQTYRCVRARARRRS